MSFQNYQGMDPAGAGPGLTHELAPVQIDRMHSVRECEVTFAQLGEDQELGLPGVRLLLTDGGSRAELDHVGVTGQLFL